jgi:hypothetical protein
MRHASSSTSIASRQEAMLAVALVATSAFAPSTTPAGLRSRAAAAPVMADRKVYAFDDTTVFEARETSVTRKP